MGNVNLFHMNAAKFVSLSATEILEYIKIRKPLLRNWYYRRPYQEISRLDTKIFQGNVLEIPHGFCTKTGKILKLPKIELVWGLDNYIVYITDHRSGVRIKISIPSDFSVSVSKYKYHVW